MAIILDFLIGLGTIVAGSAWLTGGLNQKFPGTGISLSLLDPWVILVGLMVLIRTKMSVRQPVPFLVHFGNLIQWLQAPSRNKKFCFWFSLWVFGSLTLAHVLRHWALATDAYDVTFVHQSIFWPFQERLLHCDICLSGTYFGEHISYSLLLLAPLTSWIHSDSFVFVLQTLLTILPIWAALQWGPIRRHKELWVIAIIVILCLRGLRNTLVWDFREDLLAFAFLMGASIAVYRGRLIEYGVLLFLALISKENIAFISFFMIFPILFDSSLLLKPDQRKKAAWCTGILSIAWGWISFQYLIPHYNLGVETSNNIVSRLGEFGETPREIVITLMTSPLAWWTLLQNKILTWPALRYVLYLLGPCLFFLRKGAWWLVPVIPGIMMNILSDLGQQKSLRFHYDLPIYPFIIMGTLLGLHELNAHLRYNYKLRAWKTAIIIALCMSGAWPLHQVQRYWPKEPEHLEEVSFLRNLPVSKSKIVGADSVLLAHLSNYPSLRLFRTPIEPVPKRNKDAWRLFWGLNSEGRNRIPGHSLKNADFLLFDLWQPWQKKVFGASLYRGWVVESRGPHKRFVIVKRKK